MLSPCKPMPGSSDPRSAPAYMTDCDNANCNCYRLGDTYANGVMDVIFDGTVGKQVRPRRGGPGRAGPAAPGCRAVRMRPPLTHGPQPAPHRPRGSRTACTRAA